MTSDQSKRRRRRKKRSRRRRLKKYLYRKQIRDWIIKRCKSLF